MPGKSNNVAKCQDRVANYVNMERNYDNKKQMDPVADSTCRFSFVDIDACTHTHTIYICATIKIDQTVQLCICTERHCSDGQSRPFLRIDEYNTSPGR